MLLFIIYLFWGGSHDNLPIITAQLRLSQFSSRSIYIEMWDERPEWAYKYKMVLLVIR